MNASHNTCHHTCLSYLDGFLQSAVFQNFECLQNLVWTVLTEQLNELLSDTGWEVQKVLVNAFSGIKQDKRLKSESTLKFGRKEEFLIQLCIVFHP